MLRRDLRAADAVALEAAGLDQARGVVVRRVAERAAGGRAADRLRRLAPGERFLGIALVGPVDVVLDMEARPEEPEHVARQLDVAVTPLER
ncbi:hypothetical protein D3C83_111990 [compost metagenome]